VVDNACDGQAAFFRGFELVDVDGCDDGIMDLALNPKSKNIGRPHRFNPTSPIDVSGVLVFKHDGWPGNGNILHLKYFSTSY
jgi:hypothetical protein